MANLMGLAPFHLIPVWKSLSRSGTIAQFQTMGEIST